MRWSAHRLAGEARALAARLDRLPAFALAEPMLPAAAPAPATLIAIERALAERRQALRRRVARFLAWLAGDGLRCAPHQQQQRYVRLQLEWNAVLTQLDLFADVITQRSEAAVGEQLGGLDVAAADALRLPGTAIELPPLLCYLDRGPGGAIRRARTRLPGGGECPVAIIRVPRERMVGCGIASSLVHEVGHQGAELLGLLPSLRPVLQALQHRSSGGGEDPEGFAWRCWERWLSEIVADLWSVARVGVASTLGLMTVVSLPEPFEFRFTLDDPHPMPWLRVQLSCALGEALYPHPQWQRLARQWRAFYPLARLAAPQRAIVEPLLRTIPALAGLLVQHRPRALEGRSLGEALSSEALQPARLTAELRRLGPRALALRRLPPCRVLALLGQARADGRLEARMEGQLLAELLGHWALRGWLERADATPRPFSNQQQARWPGNTGGAHVRD